MAYTIQIRGSSLDGNPNRYSHVLLQQPLQEAIDPSLSCIDGDGQPLFPSLPLGITRSYLPYPSTLAETQARAHSPSSQHHASEMSATQSPPALGISQYGYVGPLTPPEINDMALFPFGVACDSYRNYGDLGDRAVSEYVDPTEIHHGQVSLPDHHDVNGHQGREILLSQSPGHDFFSPASFEQSIQPSDIRLNSPLSDSDYPDLDMQDEIRVSHAEEEDEDYTPTPARGSSIYPKRRCRRGVRGVTATQSKLSKANIISPAGAARAFSTSAESSTNRCAQCQTSGAGVTKRQKKHHHESPFTCIFKFAGCKHAFHTKNEWKRHVEKQHVKERFWLCLHGSCKKQEKHDGQYSTVGKPFKRKDLFMQHARRMHVATICPNLADAPKNDLAGDEELEAKIQEAQRKACHKRCSTPESIECSGQECSKNFKGEKAWDEYLEHIASEHLDPTGKNHFGPVEFGGPKDKAFLKWSEDVNIIRPASTGWEICDPLESIRAPVGSTHKA